MKRKILKKSSAGLLAWLLAFPQSFVSAVWAAEQAQPAAASSGDDSGEPAPAQGPAKSSLDGMEVGSDAVTLRLSAPAKYNSFLIDKPSPKLVLELLGTAYNLGAKSVAGKGRLLQRVRSGQFSPAPHLSTRVVLDLSAPAAYKVSAQGGKIVVSLSPALAVSPVQAAPAQPAPQPAAAKVAISPKPAPAPSAPPPPPPAPPGLPKAKPQETAKASEVEPMSEEGSRELNAMASQIDAAKPAEEAEEAGGAAKAAPAKRDGPPPQAPDIMSRLPRDLISVDFENTDIKDVLRLMAAKANVNIIFGADVSGNITLHLVDAPFADAFRSVLMMMKLTTSQVGNNILRVALPATLTAEMPTRRRVTKVLQVRYKKAVDLLTNFAAARAAQGNTTGTQIVDPVANTIIVTDTEDGITAAEGLLRTLDIKPVQILIEVKLVEVDADRTLDLGIQWNYFSASNGSASHPGLTTIGGGPGSIPTGSSPPFDQLATGAQTIPSRGAGVSLLNGNPYFQLGRVANNYLLNIQLSAAATQHKAKVLSDPKIATLNNQLATIQLQTTQPYVTFTVNNTVAGPQSVPNIQFGNSGITLNVTPTIIADGRMTLDLAPNVQQTTIVNVSGQTAPQTNTRTAHATMIAHNDETVVMGGLISDSVDTVYNKIPFFGDLPGLGWLFKSKSTSRHRVELLIFVTPHILPD